MVKLQATLVIVLYALSSVCVQGSTQEAAKEHTLDWGWGPGWGWGNPPPPDAFPPYTEAPPSPDAYPPVDDSPPVFTNPPSDAYPPYTDYPGSPSDTPPYDAPPPPDNYYYNPPPPYDSYNNPPPADGYPPVGSPSDYGTPPSDSYPPYGEPTPSASSPLFPVPEASPPDTPWGDSPSSGGCSCGWWGSNSDQWPDLFNVGSTIGDAFGTNSGSTPSYIVKTPLLEALFSTNNDGYSALMKQGTGALFNSYTNRRYQYSTQQVKHSFNAALVSEAAATVQAVKFENANTGNGNPSNNCF